MEFDWSKLTRRHAVRIVPGFVCPDEKVAKAVADQLDSAIAVKSLARMNGAVVVFLDEIEKATKLIEQGVVIDGKLIPVLPLAVPAKKVTLSNVPPFVKDEELVKELSKYGKVMGPITKVKCGFRAAEFAHIVRHKRVTSMVLKNRDEELNISFKVNMEGFGYTLFATSGLVKCFGCGGEGHMISACPNKAAGPTMKKTWAATVAQGPPQGQSRGSGPAVETQEVESRGEVEEDRELTCMNDTIMVLMPMNMLK